MKKRYGLDNIIGKRSKLRYPSHILSPKTHSLYFILPANDAISEPPLNTNITLKKGDPLEFCDQFNEETYEYEEGFPLNVIVYISPSEQIFEIKAPTSTTLFGIIFELEDLPLIPGEVSLKKLFLSVLNFSLIHLNPTEDFFISDLINKVPSLYGSFFSFHKKLRHETYSYSIIKRRKPKRYLINSTSYLSIKKKRLNKLKLYIKKIKEYPDLHLIFFLLDQLYWNLEIINVWQEEDIFIWTNIQNIIILEIIEYITILSAMICIEYNTETDITIKKRIGKIDSILQILKNLSLKEKGPIKTVINLSDKIISSSSAIQNDLSSVFDEDYRIMIKYLTPKYEYNPTNKN